MYSNQNHSGIAALLIKFAPPLLSALLMIFGNAFYTTFLSVYLDFHGYTRNEIGFVQSAYFLGMLLGSFQMEKIIDRIGHVQSLAVFGSLATFATLAQSFYQTFFSWCLLRFCVGVSLAALYIVIESWMLCRSNHKTRGLVLSLYMICVYASQSVSQQLLSFIDINSFSPYVISGMFTSLSVIPVGLSRFRIEPAHEHKPLSFMRIMKISPFGCAGCLIAGLLSSSIYAFYPLFSLSVDIPSQYLMSVVIAGGVALQLPIGKLSDHYERRKILLATVIGGVVVSTSGIFMKGAPFGLIMGVSFLIGGFSFTLYPLCITQVCDHLESEHVTKATALLLIAYGIGSVIGPVVSSSMIELFAIEGLFYYLACLLGLLMVVGTNSVVRKPVIPFVTQTEFIAVPATTAVATEMDPRGDFE